MVKGLWQRLTRIGITKTLEAREARRVFYVNFITLLFMGYVTMRGIVSLPNMSYSFKLFSLNIWCVLALTLNYFHFYTVAKFLPFFTLIPGAVLLSYSQLGGYGGTAWICLFSSVPLPFILFDIKDKGRFLLANGIVFAGFAAIIILESAHPLPPNPAHDLGLVRLSATGLTYVLLLVSTWHFYASYIASEDRLVHEKRKAEFANQAKSVFLANMSHELRTPLNAILGFSELMKYDTNLTQDQASNLATIGRSGEHLLALINNVLEISKIEAGKITLRPDAFDLHRMLLGLEEMFRLRAKQKKLALIFETGPDVPRTIIADRNKLGQILINLLGNAIKFTRKGSVHLIVRRVTDGRLRFTVKDTGIGIPSNELDNIFDSFFQATGSHMSRLGTGLGLTISQQYACMMGKGITAESDTGKGSVFRFDVHMDIADTGLVQDHGPAKRVTGLKPGQPVYRILVAEDVEYSRTLIRRLLTPLGFEVHEAENGKEALEKWRRIRPQLILMDLRMPVMTGYEATRHIRLEADKGSTKIVALTAAAFEEDRATAMEAGCNDYLRKPFLEKELFGMLEKHLGITFTYDTNVSDGNATKAEADAGFIRKAVASLPAELQTRLCKSVTALDFDRTQLLINRVRERDPHLADVLVGFLNAYQFDILQELFQ